MIPSFLVTLAFSLLVHVAPHSHSLPFNTLDPDYFAPSGKGGEPQSPGGDGSIVIITEHELRSHFFYTGSAEDFVVHGDLRSSPYEQVVRVKVWGAGGGGCDGGRLQTKEASEFDTSSGLAGGYVEASFVVPTGEVLLVDVGGGGKSQGSQTHSLGGLGGYNGGKSGYKNRSSGGGGGGGMSRLSFSNGTIIAAAFGGNGGGNSNYCTAMGGLGGRLRGRSNDNDGGFINLEMAVNHVNNKKAEVAPEAKASAENVTPTIPKNRWIPLSITQPEKSVVFEANAINDNEKTWCEHHKHRPSGRRGHSMTVINSHVYIFGGATLKCVCTAADGDKKHCASKNIYSNELWEYDILSSTFTLLESPGDVPRGREQHSATALPNGDIIIIGGLSSPNEYITGDLESLNEVWKFSDPHRVSSHRFMGFDIKKKLEIGFSQGFVSSHALNADLGRDLCVDDLELNLSLDHGCPEAIEFISLSGPHVPSEQDELLQRRLHQIKVFVSTEENRQRDCNPSHFNISFSDVAAETVLSYSRLPKSGAFRPASSLAETFRGLAVGGEWRLDVSHSTSKRLETYTGSLLDWSLHIKAKFCTPKLEWEKLTVPHSFSPRHGHTAVAVVDSIFILGGFAHDGMGNDLWRFDYPSNAWTELKSAAPALPTHPMFLHGQAAALGPWGVLRYGGLGKMSGIQEQGRDVFVHNLLNDNHWMPISIANANDEVRLPKGRYFSAIALMESNDVINKLYNIDGPFLLVFGGDGGHIPNAYPNNYGFMPNALFDDMWILYPSELNSNIPIRRKDYCIDRLGLESTRRQVWNNTCGWKESSIDSHDATKLREECELGEIFIMSWCHWYIY